jgi:hypothetical protein
LVCKAGHRLKNNKSKLVAILLLWMIPAGIFLAAFRYDWKAVWNSVGVYSLTPPFLDLRSVPAAVETHRQGGDPLIANPADALQRPFNYPRIWYHLFSLLQITEQNVWIVGLVFCGLYLFCISKLILEAARVAEHAVLLLAGLSIAPLFALERGNNDLPVFAFVFLACVLARPWQRSGLLLAATVLKVFPVVALLAETLRQRGRSRIWPVAGLAVAMVILVAQRSDLALIRKGTPVTLAASYGVFSLRDTLWYLLTRHALLPPMALSVTCEMAVLCCWVAGVVVALHSWRRPGWLDDALLQSRAGEMFFVFGTIYAATFAIGSNWDYRLMFLIPTLPLAFALTRTREHSRWGILYVVCVLVAENVVAFRWGYKALFAQVATFALFLLILAMLVEQVKSYLGMQGRSALPLAGEFARLETPSASR